MKKNNVAASMIDEVVVDKVDRQPENDEIIPSPSDPEWSSFLLDKLELNELSKGSPTVDGLRRLTEKYFGEIVFSHPYLHNDPKDQNRAIMEHKLIIIKKENGREISVSAMIDVFSTKLPYPFDQHLVSTADTKAEGKALRRALKIRVQTAEEVAIDHSEEGEKFAAAPVNDQQLAAMDMIAKRLNIDVIKVIDLLAINIKDGISNENGSLIIDKLSSFQQKDAPADLLGYKSDWKTVLK